MQRAEAGEWADGLWARMKGLDLSLSHSRESVCGDLRVGSGQVRAGLVAAQEGLAVG